MKVDHEGGQLIDIDSYEYELLLHWIREGALYGASELPTSLDVEPPQIMVGGGVDAEVRVFGNWPDGERRDVTRLATLQVVDEDVAEIDAVGRIRPKQPMRASPLVARYGTVAAQGVIIVPGENGQSVKKPTIPSLDSFINHRLALLGIQSSPLCSDEEFLRRVTIDLLGRLPRSKEVDEFHSDRSPSNRENLVSRLLGSDEYGLRWGSWLAQLTGCVAGSSNEIKIAAFHMGISQEAFSNLWIDWFRFRLERDEPIHAMISDFVASTTREDRSFVEHLWWQQKLRSRVESGNGAGELFAKRRTNDLFWHVYSQKQDLYPTVTASSLLGVQLECARCHDHPMDFWTQDQFRSYQAIFRPVSNHRAPDLEKKEKQAIMKWGGAAFAILIAVVVFANILLIRKSFYRTSALFLVPQAFCTAVLAYFASGYVHVFDRELSPALSSPGLSYTLWLEELATRPELVSLGIVGLAVVYGLLATGLVWLLYRLLRGPLRGPVCSAVGAFIVVFGTMMVADASFVSRQDRTRVPMLNRYRHRLLTFRETTIVPVKNESAQPRLLDGTPIEVTNGEDPREEFARWLRDTDYLARNIVNRVWAEYFGRGLVDPPDDMSALNPPTHPALLDWLVADFRQNDWSLKHLHRQIVMSDAYQRSWRTTPSNADLDRTYARFHPRRMGGHQLLQAVSSVTGKQMDFGLRDPKPINSVHRLIGIYPSADRGGAMGARIFCSGGTAQEMRVEGAMYMLVDDSIEELIASPDGRLAKLVSSSSGTRQIIAELFQACYSRLPEQTELNQLSAFVDDGESRVERLRDVFWAIINTEEFQFNH